MKFYGQFDPPIAKIAYEKYFTDKRGGFFIEAGATDGLLISSCRFFEESMGWTGINVEPVPLLFRLLCQNRPKYINVCCALSDNNGRAVFREALNQQNEWFGNGSMRHLPEHLEELKQQQCHFEEFEVETKTYISLTENPSIPVPDFMVLDVEGHELNVMDGMKGSTKLPKIMCVEFRVSKLPEITKKMEDLGYRFDITYHNNAYYVFESSS